MHPPFHPHIHRFHSRRLGWLWAASYSRTDRLPFTTCYTFSTLARYLRAQRTIHRSTRAPAPNTPDLRQ